MSQESYFFKKITRDLLPKFCPVCHFRLQIYKSHLDANARCVIRSKIQHYNAYFRFFNDEDLYLLKHEFIKINQFQIESFLHQNTPTYTIQYNYETILKYKPLSKSPLTTLKQFISFYNFS